ncbi:MAG: preprotein translocase subunit SecG [Rhodobacteraceae bacterium]|nr:preprotein translocase subunit SecG [Paracoccaceae bacterium]
MSNVLLVVHLILALGLIGIVLVQRSEGGALGIGGGNMMTGRQSATALSKATWIVATAFLCVSLALTILTAREQSTDSIVERLGVEGAVESEPVDPRLDFDPEDLLPSGDSDTPVRPPKAE